MAQFTTMYGGKKINPNPDKLAETSSVFFGNSWAQQTQTLKIRSTIRCLIIWVAWKTSCRKREYKTNPTKIWQFVPFLNSGCNIRFGGQFTVFWSSLHDILAKTVESHRVPARFWKSPFALLPRSGKWIAIFVQEIWQGKQDFYSEAKERNLCDMLRMVLEASWECNPKLYIWKMNEKKRVSITCVSLTCTFCKLLFHCKTRTRNEIVQ